MIVFKHNNGCEYRFKDDGVAMGIYKNGEFDKACSNLSESFKKNLKEAGFKEYNYS